MQFPSATVPRLVSARFNVFVFDQRVVAANFVQH
jgi:hypothetical protein